jgi:hypothetical protein
MLQLVVGDGFMALLSVVFYVSTAGRACLMHFGLQVAPQEKFCCRKIGSS